jgi:hypothetical protein
VASISMQFFNTFVGLQINLTARGCTPKFFMASSYVSHITVEITRKSTFKTEANYFL